MVSAGDAASDADANVSACNTRGVAKATSTSAGGGSDLVMATGANGGLAEWNARSCVGGGSGCLRGLPRVGRSSCALRGIMCKGVCCLMRSLRR